MNDFFKASSKIDNNILSKWFNGNMTIYLIHVIALILIYAVILQSFDSTPNAISYLRSYFFWWSGIDSWNPMITAIEYCRQSPGANMYQALGENGIKFIYPPTSLVIFDILKNIFGISASKIYMSYTYLSWISVYFTVFFTAEILTSILKKYHFQTIARSISYILVAIITMLFFPLIKSYSLGQTQTILTMLATLVLYLYLTDRKKIAGLCLALICAVKPQLGLVFVWGLIRKEWSMVISGGITIIAILIPSIFLYGFHNHFDYLSALSFLSRHGECYYANQSINGVVNRLLFNGNNLNWSGSYPSFNPIVYLSTLFTSIILIFLGLFWNYKNTKPNVVEMSTMMLCSTMASPIAWEHHYAILLPIFILLSPFVLYYYQSEKWKILIFTFAFVVASQYLGIVDKFADSHLNILQSYLYFSALLILVFLFSTSRRILLNTGTTSGTLDGAGGR